MFTVYDERRDIFWPDFDPGGSLPPWEYRIPLTIARRTQRDIGWQTEKERWDDL